jgi:SHS2 domain-containing protein
MKGSELNPTAGFLEREHTADWELEVWAPDMPGLLEQAARGMYKLAGLRLKQVPRREHALEIPFSDEEDLLVEFLSELLFLAEEQRLAFDEFALSINDDKLSAELTGAPVSSMDKEIKAVTYHQLAVRRTGSGLQVNIVFDV